MENYNSSLYKPLKTFDIKKLVNAFQATNLGSGSATGVQFYYDKDKLSVEHAWAKQYLDKVKDYRDLMVTLNVRY